MKKTICLLLSVLLLISAFVPAAFAAAPQVKVNDTVTYNSEKTLEDSTTGSYPVLESKHRKLVIDNVKSLNDCARVDKVSSGWIVTFVKAGNAKIEIRSHEHESYSKYNTEEQKVYKSYTIKSPSQTKTEEYSVLPSDDEYHAPDGYVAVFKDGYEYVDFASQEAIDAKFGKNTTMRHANLQDFFGFSYSFADNSFNVTLDNFTGEGLFFRCPKKDTAVFLRLKGKNTLTGAATAFGKVSVYSAVSATGEKSPLVISADENGASLNVDMEITKSRNNSSSITGATAFCFGGGVMEMNLTYGARTAVKVNLTTDASLLGSRPVSLSGGELRVDGADFDYTYNTDGKIKNYSGVGSQLVLDGGAIFTGTLNNARTANTDAEYLLPKITYAAGFTGGAYYESRGGKHIKETKNEVFNANGLYKYEAAADGAYYRAVTSADENLLIKVDPVSIAPAFPEAGVGKALPQLMEGFGFRAGLSWTDGSGAAASYAEKNGTYRARATFVPTRGFYLDFSGFTAADRAKAKPVFASAVTGVTASGSTLRPDALDFQLYKIQSGSPTITGQPESVFADPGETVTFTVNAINTNPSPDGYEWHSVTYTKFLGVTIPWDTILSDNSVYSGTKTPTLTVKVNSSLYKVRCYYCKVHGAGWESVSSVNASLTQTKRITRIGLGGEGSPTPGRTSDIDSPYGYDYDNLFKDGEPFPSAPRPGQPRTLDKLSYSSDLNSPAALLDYHSPSKYDMNGCFWYEGESSFDKTPARMAATQIFEVGKTYTYRFRVKAKTGYKFSDSVEFTHEPENNTITANAYRVSDTEYLVDFTYANITSPIDSLSINNVPLPYEDGGFTACVTVADSRGYTLTAQEGWLESPDENAKTVAPKVGGTYWLHLTLVAREGNAFSNNTKLYSTRFYDGDSKLLSVSDTPMRISDGSNTRLEVYVPLTCSQKRVKNLTLNGLPVPSVGEKLAFSASASPDGVTVTSVRYYDLASSELTESYTPKAKDMITVSVTVKADEGIAFDPGAVMTWTAVGNKLSAGAVKESGMAENERAFTFIVSAHDHDWANVEDSAYFKEDATCLHGTTYYRSCAFCEAKGSATFELNDKKDHSLTGTAANAATCTADGNTGYYTCSACKKLFSDDKGTKEITLADTVTKATGHKLTKTAAKAATCTADGNIEYYTCSVCKKLFKDDKGKTEINAADTVTKATGHKLTKTAAKAATCAADGNTEYYTCSVCKKLFKDDKGKTEIKAADTVTKATGHKYGAWTKLDGSQHQRVCENDKTHVEKAAHTWDGGKITKEATASAEGERTFTCTVCGATKTEPIPKTEPAFIPGDVDGDGSVLAGDARYALRAAVGLDDTAEGLDFSKNTNRCFLAADVTGDGVILAEDARSILRAAVGLESLS